MAVGKEMEQARTAHIGWEGVFRDHRPDPPKSVQFEEELKAIEHCRRTGEWPERSCRASREERAAATEWIMRTTRAYEAHREKFRLTLLVKYGCHFPPGSIDFPEDFLPVLQKMPPDVRHEFSMDCHAHYFWFAGTEEIKAAKDAWRTGSQCSPCRVAAALAWAIEHRFLQWAPVVLSNYMRTLSGGKSTEAFATLAGAVTATRKLQGRSLGTQQSLELREYGEGDESIWRYLMGPIADLPHSPAAVPHLSRPEQTSEVNLIDVENPNLKTRWKRMIELIELASGGTTKISYKRVRNESFFGSPTLDGEPAPFFDTLPGGLDPYAELEAKERIKEDARMIEDAFAEVLGRNDQLQTILLLIDGHTRDEIAVKLGCELPTVNSHCWRIQTKLKKHPELLAVYQECKYTSRKV